jgi:hypothetical protein
MHDAAAGQRKLGQRLLEKGGELPLALVLELIVPVRRLRALARERGLTPKGGFRVDKAPAHVLAPLLAEQRDPDCIDAIVKLLVPTALPGAEPSAVVAATEDAPTGETSAGADIPGVSPGPGAEVLAAPPPVAQSSQPTNEQRALLALRVAENARLREELERSRESASRGREREAELARRIEQLQQDLLLARRGQRPGPTAPPTELVREDKELWRRLHQLEGEREQLLVADEAMQRRLAENQTRIRELEAEVAELDALLPKGKRRRKPMPEPTPDERRFRVPRFTVAFYKSFEGKDRRAIERAVQAVLLFCTEGHAYPGLEVKQLGGQELWSLRASLGLRVYFRTLPDGDIELLELGDREEQHTTLRRLKER